MLIRNRHLIVVTTKKQHRSIIVALLLALSSIFTQICFADTSLSNENTQTSWEKINHGLLYVPTLVFYSHSGYLYIGTEGSGVFKTTDGGSNWKNAGLEKGKNVHALYADGNYLYAGTDHYGVFKTTDGGETWEPTALNDKSVHALYSDGTYVYAGVEGDGGGILRTKNKGKTWDNAGLPGKDIRVLYANNSYLYAGTKNHGVFKTTDGGETWHSAGLADEDIQVLYADGTCLYAGTWGNGVFKTTDNGENWQPVPNLTNRYITSLSSAGTYLYVGTLGGTSGREAKSEVFKTRDGGVEWKNAGLDGEFPAVLYSDGFHLYAARQYAGIFKTAARETNWQKVNHGLTHTVITALHSHDGYLYLGTLSSGVFKTKDGVNWERAGLIGNDVLTLDTDTTYLYAGTSQGVFRIKSGSATWEPTNLKDKFIRSLCLHNGYLYASTLEAGVFKTNDRGESWEKTKLKNLPSTILYSDGTSLYATSWEGGVFKTISDEEDWENIGLNDTKELHELHADSTYLYAASWSAGVFKTADGGKNWQSVGLTDKHVATLYSSNANLYAGTKSHGVFRTQNGGKSWESNELLSSPVTTLHAFGTNLYAGTLSDGVYKIKAANQTLDSNSSSASGADPTKPSSVLLTRGSIPEDNAEITYLGNGEYHIAFSIKTNELPQNLSFAMINHLKKPESSSIPIKAECFCNEKNECTYSIRGKFNQLPGTYKSYLISEKGNVLLEGNLPELEANILPDDTDYKNYKLTLKSIYNKSIKNIAVESDNASELAVKQPEKSSNSIGIGESYTTILYPTPSLCPNKAAASKDIVIFVTYEIDGKDERPVQSIIRLSLPCEKSWTDAAKHYVWRPTTYIIAAISGSISAGIGISYNIYKAANMATSVKHWISARLRPPSNRSAGGAMDTAFPTISANIVTADAASQVSPSIITPAGSPSISPYLRAVSPSVNVRPDPRSGSETVTPPVNKTVGIIPTTRSILLPKASGQTTPIRTSTQSLRARTVSSPERLKKDRHHDDKTS